VTAGSRVAIERVGTRAALWGAAVLALASCGEQALLPVSAGTGPQPTLPAPQPSLIPTVNIAPAKGWPPGATPQAAPGMRVAAFASGLDHPRWLHVLPNGDVLVAETNAPPKPEDGKGIKGADGPGDTAGGCGRAQRNPNGMAWEPRSAALWTVVNERDEIGSDLVPDYLTSVRDGAVS
jgi:glucose/arabinose dehydrogenase